MTATVSASVASSWINGAAVITGGANHQVINPANGDVVAALALATPADVDTAVEVARQAQRGWGSATPVDRATVLAKLAALMSEHADELVAEEVSQTGKPARLAREFDVPGSIDNVDFFSGAARHLEGKATAEYSGDHTSSIRREAIGVVGTITPWNYPLQMAVWKVLPALAAGCSVVIKPAELTPLTTLTLARLATEAGLPDGVFNVLTGAGGDVGTALAGHPDVDVVTFTGSTPVGRKVMAAAAVHGHRTQLELGGKAPFVVFDDADLDAAIQGAVAGSLINTGQDCTAATRAIVARPLYDDFVAGVGELMSKVVVGDPEDDDTDLGPLISMAHRAKVAGMVERAPDQGGRIVTGGSAPDLPGSFYRPTLIADVGEDSEIYRDEIFGPLLPVVSYDSLDDAIAYVNVRPRPLALYYFDDDRRRVKTVVEQTTSGGVTVNDVLYHIAQHNLPFGGVGPSGMGQYHGRDGFRTFSKRKGVMVQRRWAATSVLAPPITTKTRALIARLLAFSAR